MEVFVADGVYLCERSRHAHLWLGEGKTLADAVTLTSSQDAKLGRCAVEIRVCKWHRSRSEVERKEVRA